MKYLCPGQKAEEAQGCVGPQSYSGYRHEWSLWSLFPIRIKAKVKVPDSSKKETPLAQHIWLGQVKQAHVPLVLEDFFSPFLGAPVYPSLPIDFHFKTGKGFATLLRNLLLTLNGRRKGNGKSLQSGTGHISWMLSVHWSEEFMTEIYPPRRWVTNSSGVTTDTNSACSWQNLCSSQMPTLYKK